MTRTATAEAGTVSIAGRWAEQALCAQADPDTWFPEQGRHTLTAKAKRIGTTPRERSQLRQAWRETAA